MPLPATQRSEREATAVHRNAVLRTTVRRSGEQSVETEWKRDTGKACGLSRIVISPPLWRDLLPYRPPTRAVLHPAIVSPAMGYAARVPRRPANHDSPQWFGELPLRAVPFVPESPSLFISEDGPPPRSTGVGQGLQPTPCKASRPPPSTVQHVIVSRDLTT
jgi:hypothetical protein